MAGKCESVFPKHAEKYINSKYTSLEGNWQEEVKKRMYILHKYSGKGNMEIAGFNPVRKSDAYPVQF